MSAGVFKKLGWLILSALTMMMVYGIRINWLFYAFSFTILLVFILFLEFEQRHRDTRVIALLGVLVALAVASRQLLHGIEFSPVFFIVVICGYLFGFTFGFAIGALTMFTSNFFIGHGPWTPFQMLGLGLTGALASTIPKIKRIEIFLLVVYSIISAYMYGALTDIFFWIAFIPTHTWESFAALVGAGMLANTTRAVGNVFFMSIFGPVFLRMLRRFRRRLTYSRKLLS